MMDSPTRPQDEDSLRNLTSNARDFLQTAARPDTSLMIVITRLKSAAVSLACALLRARGKEVDTSVDPDSHLLMMLSMYVEADGLLPVGSVAELKNLMAFADIEAPYLELTTRSVAHRLRWVRAFTLAAVPILEEAVPGVTEGLAEAVEGVLTEHVPAELRGDVLKPWPIRAEW